MVDAAPPPEPPLMALAEVSGAERITARPMGSELPKSAQLCRRIDVRDVQATGDPKADARFAFDNQRDTVWNAGNFAPQAIRARLAPEERVAVVVFIPEMTPNGVVSNVFEFAGASEERKLRVEGPLATDTAYIFALDRPVATRTLTVRTLRSPSWIAFREIMLLSCDAPIDLGPPPPPPAPPRPAETFVPGAGACHKDADCVPSDCCHARTCNAIGRAPRCDGIGCSQNVAPNTLDVGACACVKNQCGANIRKR